MGLLDFLKDAGQDLFKGKDGRQADAVKGAVASALGSHVSNLNATFDDGKVTLTGQADSMAAKEKAALVAGNIQGVSSVNDNGLTAPAAAAPAAGAAATGATRYYTIKSGDSLSKIAKEMYGDAGDYNKIFEANKEVIGDPDKIYPGQQIRIPA